jgi:hypothetical protein
MKRILQRREFRPALGVASIPSHRQTVALIPLSSSPAGSPPLLVPLTCEGGRTAVAVVDQIGAVTKRTIPPEN